MANKTDLVGKVHELLNEQGIEITKKDSVSVVEAVIEGIQSVTIEEGKLQLIGFGNFEVRERAARKGRNPQTGEEIEIAATKVPAFKPGKEFKERVK